MKRKIATHVYLSVLLTVLFFNGCSIKKMAMNTVANALTGDSSSTVFTGDNDPELVGAALPFAIKMYESLLASNHTHRGLQLTTGSLYVMYANAFIHTPASMLPDAESQTQEFMYKRAKNLYIRGRDIILNGLELKHKGFKALLEKRQFKEALAPFKKQDASMLYWAGAGWMGAFAIDPFDMDFGVTLPGAAALIEKVLELDPNFGKGDIHNFYILYYGSLPEYMGGSYEKARKHFQLAVQATGGKSAAPYLSLATTVSIADQNVSEFTELLNKALAINPDENLETRLVNTLDQRKARWFLEHVDDFFLPKEEPPQDPNQDTEENQTAEKMEENK